MQRPIRRVAIQARVSTVGQEAENQLMQLRSFCEQQGWPIVGEYIDVESGRKGRRERAQFDRLLKDAAKRKFDLVLFWSLDRFSRQGIWMTISYLRQLDSYGVRFKSFTEEYLDTDNELVGYILIGVLSYFAEQEAVKISTRTKAGLARVRASGKTLGRPDGFARWKTKLTELHTRGSSVSAISRETGLAVNTVKKYLARL